MKSYPGIWLTGSLGTERLLTLSNILRQKVLEDVNKKLDKSFRSYQPWMCSPALYEAFSLRPRKHPSESSRRGIVTNKEELEWLQNVFTTKNGKSLDRLVEEGLNHRIAIRESDYSDFRSIVESACEIVAASSPCFEKRLNSLVDEIIPLGPADPSTSLSPIGSGMSSYTYRGGLFFALAFDRSIAIQEMAIAIVHELGHQAIMIYQYADRMLESDFNAPVFSALRRTERPALMSFHAVGALAYMIEFLRIVSHQHPYFEKVLREITPKLRVGYESISKSVSFTQLGSRMMCEFRAILSEAC